MLIDGGSEPGAQRDVHDRADPSPVNATIDPGGRERERVLADDVPQPPTGEVNIIPAGGERTVRRGEGRRRRLPAARGRGADRDRGHPVHEPRTGGSLVHVIAGEGVLRGHFGLTEISSIPKKPVVVVEARGRQLTAKCPRALALSGARRPERPAGEEKPIRRLWGKGKGRFRTRGRYASGTVRGTNWLTQDFCEGTRPRVVEGVVLVYDLVAKKWKTSRRRARATSRRPAT